MTDPSNPDNPVQPPAPSGYEAQSSNQPIPPQPAPGYGAPQPAYGAPGYGPPQPGYGAPQAAGRPTNSMAIVALVAGIAGWTLVPVLGSIVAVIVGPMALGQIRQTGEEGATLAKVGLWLGWGLIALSVLAVLAVVAFVGIIGVASTTTR